MRNKGFQKTLELVKQYILYGEAKCQKLLKVVENNQRYNFRSCWSIYDNNPQVSAYAKFDDGREQFDSIADTDILSKG